VKFYIEFGKIARIQRGEEDFGAVVTLRDGRTFELSESNDVTWDNKGIFIWLEPEFHALGTVPAGAIVADPLLAPDGIPGASAVPLSDTAAPPSDTLVPPSDPDISASERPWRYVSWEDFKEIRFDHRTRAERVKGGV